MPERKLLAERKNARIYESRPWNTYEVVRPDLNEQEREFFDFIDSILSKRLSDQDLQKMFMQDPKKERFVENIASLLKALEPYSQSMMASSTSAPMLKLIDDFVIDSAPFVEHKSELLSMLAAQLVGFGKLAPILDDDLLEEVMVNGARPVFVFDQKFGICKTSISFESNEEVMDVVQRIAQFVSKEISASRPLMDARLPDGSRVNVTIPPISPKGPTLTIRKFRNIPLTITEMIANNTITIDLAAFLWLCVEGMHVYPMNMIVAGGTGSGKTTTLNALSVFVPLSDRMITIEDTLELNFYERENWIQMEARRGVFEDQITMDDLLKNSLRMRPDRMIVGEVRGPEAQTMFVAMNTGHQGLMGTLHANTSRETVMRLQDPPMSVPTAMFRLLDLIVMQARHFDAKKGLVRRVTQVSECSVMGGTVSLEDLFAYNPESGELERTTLPSRNLERFSQYTGKSKMEIKDELNRRKAVLDYLVKNKIFDYVQIQKIVNDYVVDPYTVMSKVGLPGV